MVRRYAEYSKGTAIDSEFVTGDGVRLGRWADRQRIARVIGTLPPGRELDLDAVGFDWRAEPVPRTDAKRVRMLTELAAYREMYGTAEVPVQYTTECGERLGEWLYRQIKRWRTGTLAVEEQAVLGVFGVSPGARRRGPRVAATSA